MMVLQNHGEINAWRVKELRRIMPPVGTGLKTLHFYITRQVLASLLLTVAVFTFILLLGNVLKEIISLLVARQITLVHVIKAVSLLIPFVMAYVLPFAMLTAVLLTFGRFSADQELTAIRASGVSLIAVTAPVLLLSLAFCGVCAFFNLWVAPNCRSAYKDLIFQIGSRSLAGLITEDRFITEIPGMTLYVRKKAGNELEDVRLYTLENGEIKVRMSAKRGEVIVDEAANSIVFRLFNAITEMRRDKEAPPDPDFVGPMPLPDPTAWYQFQTTQFESDTINLSELLKTERKPRIREMDIQQLWQERRRLEQIGIPSGPVRVQIHRQIAFSFACFGFTLVAIPLAIQAHRRETSIGMAVALMLVGIYYSFLIVSQAFEARESLHPHLLVWFPNFLFQAVGGFLLWRANKG